MKKTELKTYLDRLPNKRTVRTQRLALRFGKVITELQKKTKIESPTTENIMSQMDATIESLEATESMVTSCQAFLADALKLSKTEAKALDEEMEIVDLIELSTAVSNAILYDEQDNQAKGKKSASTKPTSNSSTPKDR